MARRMTTKKAENKITAKTASVKETPAKSVTAAPVEKAVKAETEETENAKVTAVKKEEKSMEGKETAQKKTTRKATVRKTAAAKKESVDTEVYVQFWGKEIHTKDVVESIKKVWVEELGKKESDMKELRVYIKPEDNGAHYVINGEITGFIGM